MKVLLKPSVTVPALLALAVLAWALWETALRADPPTERTSAAMLAQVSLTDAPPLYTPTQPAAAAAPRYRAAAEYFTAHQDALEYDPPKSEPVDALADLLIAAMQAGTVAEGFLDRDTPIVVGMGPYDSPMAAVVGPVLSDLRVRYEQGLLRPRDGEAALALFVLGRRAFEHNTLLGNRWFGLSLMNDAGAYLSVTRFAGDSAGLAEMARVATAVNRVNRHWAKKLQAVMSTDPHVGDLLNVARHDADRGFRIMATLQLGVARYTNGRLGNRWAIDAYLREGGQSDDPLIAEAAEAAAALTLDALHRLN